MDVVNAILSEEEVYDMPLETLSAFTLVFNSEMLKNVNDYIKNPAADKAVVEKLQACDSFALKGSLFDTQIADKNIPQMVREYDLRSLPDLAYNHEVNLPDVIDALTWLSKNESGLRATVAPRTEDKFNRAKKLMIEYQKNPQYAHQHDIPYIMDKFEYTLFCPKQEKSRKSDNSRLATNRIYWKMQLCAAKYLNHCITNGISRSVAGEC